MERYLIINADDYGMSQSTNQAIEHLFNEGFITSTTLMTPCPWAEDGLARAKANVKMRVGLHLTFNSEYKGYKWGPVCKTELVPSLMGEDGYFYRDLSSFLMQAKADEINAEMEAQLRFMTSRGYRPTHVDNHMGSLYGLEGPSYLKEVFVFCAKHGFNFRLPRSAKTYGDIPDAARESLSMATAAADEMGIGIIDNLCSHPFNLTAEDSYESVREYYLNLIRNAPIGVTEIFVHPAMESPELKFISSKWQKRVWEYQLMLDEMLIKTIEAEGIKLVGWMEAPLLTNNNLRKA